MLRTRVKVSPTSSVLLGLVTAFLLVGIHLVERLTPALAPELGHAAKTTLRLPQWDLVPNGDAVRVIPAGTQLRASVPVHQAAVSLDRESRPPKSRESAGLVLIYAGLLVLLSLYLSRFAHSRLRLFRAQLGLMIMVAGVFLASKALLLFTALPAYVVPVGLVPLWVATSFDRRSGILVGAALAFVFGTLLTFEPLALVALLSQGVGAALFLRDSRRDRSLLIAGITSGVVSAAFLLAAQTAAARGQFGLSYLDFGCAAAGGALSGLLATLAASFAARLLGQVPRETLLDLTDLEQPLLKKMAREAPGSWEHARAMANLAEAAASAIGADALLTRVGAYYHDLGKTKRAKYFIENLEPGELSPHENLEPDASAKAIMAHVIEGTELLRDGNIPEPVVEFAYTHHGTQLVEYFYAKCQEMGNPKGLSEADFRYPGMKPQSRETAILMLVDSIEAASRTIDPPERAAFEAMIQRVVFTKLGSGQLDESGLVIEDLRVLIHRMSDTLVNMHHHRIKYPWQKRQAEQFGVPLGAMGTAPTPQSVVRPDPGSPPSQSRPARTASRS